MDSLIVSLSFWRFPWRAPRLAEFRIPYDLFEILVVKPPVAEVSAVTRASSAGRSGKNDLMDTEKNRASVQSFGVGLYFPVSHRDTVFEATFSFAARPPDLVSLRIFGTQFSNLVADMFVQRGHRSSSFYRIALSHYSLTRPAAQSILNRMKNSQYRRTKMSIETNNLSSEGPHPGMGHHYEIHFFVDGEP